MPKPLQIPEHLTWRDYFQIVATGIMGVESIYILWETLFLKRAIPAMIFGFTLLLYVIYRIRMIWIYFVKRKERHDVLGIKYPW